MTNRLPPHLREAASRMVGELPDDELHALLAAMQKVNETTTVEQLLTDLFRQLGHSEAAAAEAATAAIAAGPPDFREKLN